MAISSAYVVGASQGRVVKFTRKREAIRAAHRLARQRVGQRVNVQTLTGELVYQCHAQREGRQAIRIVAEEL